MNKNSLPMDKTERWTNSFLRQKNKDSLVRAHMHYFCEAKMHTHDFYEINFVMHGNGKYFRGDSNCNAKVGDVFIVQPDAYHGYLKNTDFYIYNFCIHQDFFKQYRREIEQIPPISEMIEGIPYLHSPLQSSGFSFHLSSSEMVLVKNDLDLMVEYDNMNTKWQENLKNILALKILSYLSYLYSRQYEKWVKKDENNNFAAIMESIYFMKENFSDKITVDDLSNVAHMSRSSYIRYFKHFFSATPIEYLRNLRLSHAKKMLQEGKNSKSFVAQECGFYDTAHLLKYL